MKYRIRGAALTALGILAVYLGVWAVNDVRRPQNKPDYYMEAAAIPDGTEYILRDFEGRIGIFAPGSMKKPRDLTEIETKQLRESDRKMLQQGIPVSSRDELLGLLEDLGS